MFKNILIIICLAFVLISCGKKDDPNYKTNLLDKKRIYKVIKILNT